MKDNILFLETIADEAMKLVVDNNKVNYYFLDANYDKSQIDGIITRGTARVNAELIGQYPSLKCIAKVGVGVDNVDVKFATSKGIQVLNTPGINASTMAEHTLALILMLQRNMYNTISKTKEDDWNSRKNYVGDEISGKVLGIIGMGDIGKKVANLASAFGMKIIYWNRSDQKVPFDLVSLEELSQKADIISVHLPLTQETEGILDSKFFVNVKKGALLVNTARGKIVDDAALLDALDHGNLSGYAADVLSKEPPPENHPLMTHPKTLITPHIGSLTKSTYDHMCYLSLSNLLAIVSNEVVDKKFLYNQV